MNLKCFTCDTVCNDPIVKENGPHKEARCSKCGAYIKFLNKTEYKRYLALKERRSYEPR